MIRTASNPMRQLADLMARGLQPVRREVWIGLGFAPPKRCAIAIDPARLPSTSDCGAVLGLDVILTYHGETARYGQLRTLCGDLMAASPRRLLAVDIDAKKVAYLKLEAV